ncbi:hypothetical protein, partial [Hominisplanchenecus murintestinalis]|uniref:hypothetical protein n=1 Tax=Hominisplanchenecus murintestinalis TaxID=2941517 RepID=UPI002042216E
GEYPAADCTVGIATINVPCQFKITQSDFKGIVCPFLWINRLISRELVQGFVVSSIFICS